MVGRRQLALLLLAGAWMPAQNRFSGSITLQGKQHEVRYVEAYWAPRPNDRALNRIVIADKALSVTGKESAADLQRMATAAGALLLILDVGHENESLSWTLSAPGSKAPLRGKATPSPLDTNVMMTDRIGGSLKLKRTGYEVDVTFNSRVLDATN